jgi:hypothetical protein
MSRAESHLWDITVTGSHLRPTDMRRRIAQHNSGELSKPTGYIDQEER